MSQLIVATDFTHIYGFTKNWWNSILSLDTVHFCYFHSLDVLIKKKTVWQWRTIHSTASDLIITVCLQMPSYLAGVDTAVEPSTKHVSSDMVAINFWLPTSVMRNQSHSRLLQTRVTLCLCQIKHKQLITLQESGMLLSWTRLCPGFYKHRGHNYPQNTTTGRRHVYYYLYFSVDQLY